MILKLALIIAKKIPQQLKPIEDRLEENNDIVHLSRPANQSNKLKTPIRIINK